MAKMLWEDDVEENRWDEGATLTNEQALALYIEYKTLVVGVGARAEEDYAGKLTAMNFAGASSGVSDCGQALALEKFQLIDTKRRSMDLLVFRRPPLVGDVCGYRFFVTFVANRVDVETA